MTENEAIAKMVPPGQRRKGKYREGVIQVWLTRACDMACFGCTQGSNLGGRVEFMSLKHFEQAVVSLKGYFGVVGVFGGNPALHPEFEGICEILSKHIPFEQRGLWCNNPVGKAKVMRGVFNPAYCNLNVHLNRKAYDEFRRDWPEAIVFGLDKDSRHSPPYVALKDVIPDEGKRWELISDCDINKHWSAMIGVFRGQLRAWFCEIAGAQAMLHQHEPDYPATGLPIVNEQGLSPWWKSDLGETREEQRRLAENDERIQWWQLPMGFFSLQVRKHCHDCGVPLRGYGELAQAETGMEQVSLTHVNVYRPKRQGRGVELVTTTEQLKQGRIEKVTDYLGNARR